MRSTIFKLLVLFFLCLVPKYILAQSQWTITPSLTLSEQWNDNVYLDETDKVSDYITMLSPGISLDASSSFNTFSLSYSPTFVYYYHESSEDDIRHTGDLFFGRDFTERLRFEFSDTYIQSEDPIEIDEDIDFNRETLNEYRRNTSEANLIYAFGPENSFLLGYSYGILENEDITLDDRTISNPYTELAYWFNTRNGLEIDYHYTYIEYDRDDDILAPDSYYTNEFGASYIHRFRPQTEGSINYAYTQSYYEDDTENYKIHHVSLGLSHALSETLSIDMAGGYAIRDIDGTEDEVISTYSVTLNKIFNRGSFYITGESGWQDDYWEADSRGLVQYWTAESGIDYQIMERLNFYASGGYTLDQDESDVDRRIRYVSTGLRQDFLRWFFISLDYSYFVRDDDVAGGGYNNNRVTLSLGASKPYRL